MFQTPIEIVGAQCSGRRVSGGVLAGDGYFRGGRGEGEFFRNGFEEKRGGDLWFGMVIWRHSFSLLFFFSFSFPLVEEGTDR